MIISRALVRQGRPLDLVVVFLVSLLLAACSGGKDESKPAGRTGETTATTTPSAASAGEAEEPLPPLAYESALPEDLRGHLDEPFTGDLDEMVKRRLVRVGVAFNRTLYFVDQGVQRGAAYEYGKLMEDELNKRRKTGNLKVHLLVRAPAARPAAAGARERQAWTW